MTLAARAGAARGLDLGARFTDAFRIATTNGVALHHARERATGRAVVVKAVAKNALLRAREELVREAAVAGVLAAHPHVHTLYERIDAGGALLLSFERCAGSLDELFRHALTPAQTVVQLGIKLAGALETMHRAGFVHCAVDPANVFLTEWAEPVLGNFGATVPVRGAYGVVDDPTVHTAPEVLLGEEIGPTTDVYGLASVLYWLVAGRPAIVASGGLSVAALSASVLCSSVAPVWSPDVPIDLSDLLAWSLSSDGLARPPSAIWFGEELRRIEKAQGWELTPMTIGTVEQ